MIALSVDLATLDDTAAICALDRQILGSDGRGGEIERAIDSGTCFVARIEGALAGYAIHDRSRFGRPFLALLVVDSSMRRRGVGTALVRHIEAVVEAIGSLPPRTGPTRRCVGCVSVWASSRAAGSTT